MADELGRLEAAAYQWRTCVEAAAVFGRALPPERYLEAKLECLDAEGMATLLDFCGLTPQDGVIERFRGRYRPDIARRRGSLSEVERALVAPYVVAANAFLGYGTDSEKDAG